MPLESVVLNVPQKLVKEPIVWRLGRLFNVVTNLVQGQVSSDYASLEITLEGSTKEVADAKDYLASLGVLDGDASSSSASASSKRPEDTLTQGNTIHVRLSTVNADQSASPILYRAGKDFPIVINIEYGQFNQTDGGTLDVAISGPLYEVQRGIAYLHTTGISVNPRQRSVTDSGNL